MPKRLAGASMALGSCWRAWRRGKGKDPAWRSSPRKWGVVKRRLGELGMSEVAVADALEALEEEEKRLGDRIGAHEERRDELSELVAQIEDHIEGSVCPICGEDHGSVEKLLDRIAAHLGEEIAKEERLQLDAVRRRADELNGRVEGLQASRRSNELRRRELLREREALATAIGVYERSLAEFGVRNRQSSSAVREELEGLLRSWERASLEVEPRSSAILKDLEKTRRDLDEGRARHKAARSEFTRLESDRERISASRRRFADDRRAHGNVGLEVRLETVSERRKSIEERIPSVRKSLEQVREAVAEQGQLLSRWNAELESKEGDLAVLIEDVAGSGASCREMEATLASAGIGEDAGEGEVLRRMEVLEKQSSSINALIKGHCRRGAGCGRGDDEGCFFTAPGEGETTENQAGGVEREAGIVRVVARLR